MIRHSKEKATWPTTSALVKLRARRLLPAAAVPSLRAATTSVCEARSAGASPKRPTVMRETRSTEASRLGVLVRLFFVRLLA